MATAKQKPSVKARPSKPACVVFIRTHDGERSWEAACECGWRSPQYFERQDAEEAGEMHTA